MPIRFRCGYCNRLLGIARRKAGSETTCPHCGYTVTVPEDSVSEPTEMEDLDALLNPLSGPDPDTSDLPSSPPSRGPVPIGSRTTQTALPSTTLQAVSSTATASTTHTSEDRLLLDRNRNAVLADSNKVVPPVDAGSKPVPAPGTQATTLVDGRSQIVLSVRKASVLVVVVVILIALSFAAGFLLASAK